MIHRDELSYWRDAAKTVAERAEVPGRDPARDAQHESERGALINEGKTLRDECPRVWAMLEGAAQPNLQSELVFPEARKLTSAEYAVALLAQAGLAQFLISLPFQIIETEEDNG